MIAVSHAVRVQSSVKPDATPPIIPVPSANKNDAKMNKPKYAKSLVVMLSLLCIHLCAAVGAV